MKTKSPDPDVARSRRRNVEVPLVSRHNTRRMPGPTNAEQRLTDIRCLVEELDSIVDLNTDESRGRCRHIVVELASLFKADDDRLPSTVATTVENSRIAVATAEATRRAGQETRERASLARLYSFSERVHRENEDKKIN